MPLSFPAWLPPLLAFCVSTMLLRLLLHVRLGLDHPNARSLHETPIPRTGGLALLGGAAAGWAAASLAFPIVVGAGFLLAVSLVDDVRGVPASIRFVAHFLAALICVGALLRPGVGIIGVFIAALAVVWGCNLYNFMDGSDGLAGGMALIGFGAYGVVAAAAHEASIANPSFCIAASSGAFLLFNFYPARLFMGDSGSVPLGFIAGTLGILGWQRGLWPFWFPVLVFSPFIMDASVTLAKRVLRKERIWQAHRQHYYQRLVLMGWGHRRVALMAYGLMGLAGSSAYWGIGLGAGGQLGLLAAWAAVYGLLMMNIDRGWVRYTLNEGRC